MGVMMVRKEVVLKRLLRMEWCSESRRGRKADGKLSTSAGVLATTTTNSTVSGKGWMKRRRKDGWEDEEKERLLNRMLLNQLLGELSETEQELIRMRRQVPAASLTDPDVPLERLAA